jgi:hypothetical protein
MKRGAWNGIMKREREKNNWERRQQNRGEQEAQRESTTKRLNGTKRTAETNPRETNKQKTHISSAPSPPTARCPHTRILLHHERS